MNKITSRILLWVLEILAIIGIIFIFREIFNFTKGLEIVGLAAGLAVSVIAAIIETGYEDRKKKGSP